VGYGLWLLGGFGDQYLASCVSGDVDQHATHDLDTGLVGVGGNCFQPNVWVELWVTGGGLGLLVFDKFDLHMAIEHL
jgi:hypothetical protein